MNKLKNTRVLTVSAMLLAIAIALSFFKIVITSFIEIRFTTLPIAIGAYLFGPVVGGILGALTDIGGYIIRPTGAYFPGFTISTALTGVIFGIVLRKPFSIKKLIIAQVINLVVVGILLNSLWLSILYKNAFIPVLIARLPKELIMLPINTIIMTVIMKPVSENKTLNKLVNE